eukprot:m.360736 g.360736  ORF g.360736 m.360736 type:complete len:1098 (+) comp19151_c0_seq1:623-3916(+)
MPTRGRHGRHDGTGRDKRERGRRKAKASGTKLSVFVRVRPQLEQEKEAGHESVVDVVGGNVLVLNERQKDASDVLRKHRSRSKNFGFDAVFDGETDQQAVYAQTTKPLLKGVLNGYNATVFAYGPTGAGKTYTMLGQRHNPGIMARTLHDLFRLINRREDRTYNVTMTYVEIYNEMLYDLLVDDSSELELREDAKGNNVICGALEVAIDSPKQVMTLLHKGNRRRTQEATAANATSSRSHAILSIKVVETGMLGAQKMEKVGQLYMCDLAGSERAAHTKNVGVRMKEGQHINRSLLALGNCINSLGGTTRARYVNYRDSKLTRLLKDALGGSCRTVMVAHVGPCDYHFEESYNTLVYANRAKNIKTHIVQNRHTAQAHIAEYTKVIESLQEQVATLRQRLADRQKSAAARGAHGSSTSTDHSGLVELMALQDQLDTHLMDDIVLFEKLQTTKQELWNTHLGVREHTATALKADQHDDILVAGSNDDLQMVQLVQDQTALATSDVDRLEAEHKALLHQLTEQQHGLTTIVEEVKARAEGNDDLVHLIQHLTERHRMKLERIQQDMNVTSLAHALDETAAAMSFLGDHTKAQASIIREQLQLLQEHQIQLPPSLLHLHRNVAVDHRVAVAMAAIEATLPLDSAVRAMRGDHASGGTKRKHPQRFASHHNSQNPHASLPPKTYRVPPLSPHPSPTTPSIATTSTVAEADNPSKAFFREQPTDRLDQHTTKPYKLSGLQRQEPQGEDDLTAVERERRVSRSKTVTKAKRRQRESQEEAATTAALASASTSTSPGGDGAKSGFGSAAEDTSDDEMGKTFSIGKLRREKTRVLSHSHISGAPHAISEESDGEEFDNATDSETQYEDDFEDGDSERLRTVQGSDGSSSEDEDDDQQGEQVEQEEEDDLSDDGFTFSDFEGDEDSACDTRPTTPAVVSSSPTTASPAVTAPPSAPPTRPLQLEVHKVAEQRQGKVNTRIKGLSAPTAMPITLGQGSQQHQGVQLDLALGLAGKSFSPASVRAHPRNARPPPPVHKLDTRASLRSESTRKAARSKPTHRRQVRVPPPPPTHRSRPPADSLHPAMPHLTITASPYIANPRHRRQPRY